MNRVDAWRMVQRRAAELGMRIRVGCHTFRATGITAYLEAGGTLENAKPWPRTKARARPSSTTAPATRLPSMRSSGLRFEERGASVPDLRLTFMDRHLKTNRPAGLILANATDFLNAGLALLFEKTATSRDAKLAIVSIQTSVELLAKFRLARDNGRICNNSGQPASLGVAYESGTGW